MWDSLAMVPEAARLLLAAGALAWLGAAVLGLALGAWLGMAGFPGRGVVVGLVNLFLGVPPVVVAVVVAVLGLRLPQGALVPAVVALASAPAVAALVGRTLAAGWAGYGRALQASGASRVRALRPLLGLGRRAVGLALLAGLGRVAAELGGLLHLAGDGWALPLLLGGTTLAFAATALGLGLPVRHRG